MAERSLFGFVVEPIKPQPVTIGQVRVLWSTIRDKQKSWAFLKVYLDGEDDLAACKHCGETQSLTEAENPNKLNRVSVLRRFAREHYYRHGLDWPNGKPAKEVKRGKTKKKG